MKTVQFKMILRGWARNKVYTVISILSLIVGLTCCILMGGFVMNEYQIAGSVPDSDHWYTLKSKDVFAENSEIEILGGGVGNIGACLKNEFPEVQEYCVFHNRYAGLKEKNQPSRMDGFWEATPNTAALFQLKVLEGDLRETLSRPGEIAVTRSFAMQVYGQEQIIGKALTFNISKAIRTESGIYSKLGEETYTVTSIVDDSERGLLNFKILKGLPDEEVAFNLKNWVGSYFTFIRLDNGVSGKEFEKKMRSDSTFQNRKLVSMSDVYFTSVGDWEGITISRDPRLLYIGSSIALAVLIIACFNYINLGMTRALQRLRNTGQQMVFGASKGQMRMQLLLETSMQAILALALALVCVWNLLPRFNALFESRLMLEDLYTGTALWILGVLLLLIIILPSLYIFSRLGESRLGKILKQEYSCRPRLITGMVVAQFAVSIVLLLFMVNVHQQMDFVAHNRPDAEHILLLNEDENVDEDAWEVFCERLLMVPEIEKMASGSGLSEGAVSNGNRLVNIINSDAGYFDFYNLKFVEGHPFTAVSPEGTVVVNETFVKNWEIREPIGYSFDFNGGHYTICGVVRDFIMESLNQSIGSLMIVPEDAWQTVLMVSPENRKAAIGKMMALWKEIAPDQPAFSYRTMADAYLGLHRDEQKMMKMVLTFSWISLMLTCLGLFGLAWYSVENRMKEIALRKVSGATEVQVIKLLCGRFMKWILGAFLIALPLAFYFTGEWMKQFVYKEYVPFWMYVAVGLFALSVGILTVIWQSWHASVRNPVEVLKND